MSDQDPTEAIESKPGAKAEKSKPAMAPPDSLDVARCPEESMAEALGRAALRPSVKAAVTIQRLSKKMLPDVRLMPLVNELQAQAELASNGNLQRTEGMLIIQAHTLDTIFNELARVATLNMGEYLGAAETYMRVALKAQSQCRATLETLAQIKNPSPVAFVRQANIANGSQQVNNGAGAASHAWETENQPNKLLEQSDGERLDAGPSGAAKASDPRLASLDAFDRPPNGRRKG